MVDGGAVRTWYFLGFPNNISSIQPFLRAVVSLGTRLIHVLCHCIFGKLFGPTSQVHLWPIPLCHHHVILVDSR